MSPNIRYFIPLGIAVSLLSLLVYFAGYQILRGAANDPQVQIAEDFAFQIARSTQPPPIPPQKADMVKSLSPYVVLYNDRGQAVLGNVQLDGKTPVPQPGVFDRVRKSRRADIVWEPRKNVRHAVVVVRVDGERKGFLLAGRSMRETEARIAKLQTQVIFMWLITLFAAFGATMIFAPRTLQKISKKA